MPYKVGTVYLDGCISLYDPSNPGAIQKIVLSKECIKAAWGRDLAPGQHAARLKKNNCVVFPVTDELDAMRMAAMFTEWGGAIICTHWDGKELSLYCGNKDDKRERGDLLYNSTYMAEFLEDLEPDERVLADDYVDLN